MKHRSRLEREEQEDKQISEMEQATADDNARIKIITARITAIQSGKLDDEADADDIEGLQGEIDELRSNIDKRNQQIKASWTSVLGISIISARSRMKRA